MTSALIGFFLLEYMIHTGISSHSCLMIVICIFYLNYALTHFSLCHSTLIDEETNTFSDTWTPWNNGCHVAYSRKMSFPNTALTRLQNHRLLLMWLRPSSWRFSSPWFTTPFHLQSIKISKSKANCTWNFKSDNLHTEVHLLVTMVS